MASKIIILTGEIRTGKTTHLQKELKSIQNKFGILTPVIDSKRIFQNISDGSIFNMEATENENDVYTIGRFVFSRFHFTKAVKILEHAIKQENALVVIDEMGPLELKGEGFAEIIKKAIQNNRQNTLLLVVRKPLLADAIDWIKKVKADIGITVFTIEQLLLKEITNKK